MGVSFERVAKIPDVPSSLNARLFVQVYDQFGEAHEAEFCISLHPQSRGVIVSERQQSRDESF
jgi:hypothetical protein